MLADQARTDGVTSEIWQGIELCRNGEWDEGFVHLSQAAESHDSQDLPSLFFAYLGYCLARSGNRKKGLEVCRRAVSLDPYQAESFICLARCWIDDDKRREALDAIRRGLQIDPTNKPLKNLRRRLGRRRRPVLPFLQRNHPLNRTFGRVRHWILGPKT